MRRNSPALIIGASLLVGACSAGDRAATPTGPIEQPNSPSFATSTTTGVCAVYYPSGTTDPTKANAAAIQQIVTELGYVYPRLSPPLVALQVISNLLSVALKNAQQTQAQQFAVQIINRLQSDLKAEKLRNPPQPNIGNFTTKDDVVDDLVKRLQCLTALPVTGNSLDAGVGVVTPNAASTIVTGSQKGGAFFPAGSVNNTTVVTVVRLPNGPQLLTSLHQFPRFFEITSSNPNAQITQQNQVIVGICNIADNTGNPSLLIAHLVDPTPANPPSFGDVEVLPPVTAAFLDCTTEIGSTAGKPRNFAAASWRAVSTGLGSFAKTLFLPAELHATILLGGGPGGFTGKFSPFGTVDINSNPATLSIVSPAGGFVSGSGNVSVKATSAAGTFSSRLFPGNPIPGVPVNFEGTIVPTDANGVATFPWTTAAPGATLTATVPNEEGCPSGPDGAVTVAYRPKVCFTPSSVTFTTSIVSDYRAAQNYSYLFVGTSEAPTPSSTTPPEGWFTTSFDASSWPIALAPFGDVDQYAGTCSIFTSSPKNSEWLPSTRDPDFYQKADAPTSSTSGLLARKTFPLPTGFSGTVVINVAIDNDIALYLNGTPLLPNTSGVTFTPDQTTTVSDGTGTGWTVPAYNSTAGFWIHGGCATQGSGRFSISTASAPAGLLKLGEPKNLLAVFGRDRGGATYFDAQVTLTTP